MSQYIASGLSFDRMVTWHNLILFIYIYFFHFQRFQQIPINFVHRITIKCECTCSINTISIYLALYIHKYVYDSYDYAHEEDAKICEIVVVPPYARDSRCSVFDVQVWIYLWIKLNLIIIIIISQRNRALLYNSVWFFRRSCCTSVTPHHRSWCLLCLYLYDAMLNNYYTHTEFITILSDLIWW